MQEEVSESGAGRMQKTWRGYAQIALLVVVLGAAFYFARAPQTQAGPEDVLTARVSTAAPEVAVVLPQPMDQALTIHLTGTVTLQETAQIQSEVEGRIEWLSPNFHNGGYLEADEPIVRLDASALELRVEEARADVAAAEARVWLEEAQGQENLRLLELTDPDAEPSEWQQRLPHAALAQAELRRAQALLGLAELQLAGAEITLPYDVRVVTMKTAVGEWVNPESDLKDSLGTVYEPRLLQVRVPIEPEELAYLEPAAGRRARLQGRLGAWNGTVARVASVVNPASRLTTVFIDFDEHENLEALPLPGMFLEVSLQGPEIPNAFLLPTDVLQEASGIWVVRDGILESFQPQEYGRMNDGWVVQAFDAGEGVVVGPLAGAREGLEVNVAG